MGVDLLGHWTETLSAVLATEVLESFSSDRSRMASLTEEIDVVSTELFVTVLTGIS